MARGQKVALNSLQKSKKALYVCVIVLLGIIFFSSVTSTVKKSLFFSRKDRINLVVYGQHTAYYSLGVRTAGNYIISFFPDIKLQIPGGYGAYRVGALGKLISWDKKPEILQRTFSLATYSFTDYYFYQGDQEVYFGSDSNFSLPQAQAILSAQSNATFLDRVYLVFAFLNKRKSDFQQIPIHADKNRSGDAIFAADKFEKKYTGYLFQQTYRKEGKSVQIFYSDSYVDADRVGKMLEGNGVRVGDISQEGSLVRGCVIREDSDNISLTAAALINVFHCQWKKGKTDFYDILFQLGEKEKEWEIKE